MATNTVGSHLVQHTQSTAAGAAAPACSRGRRFCRIRSTDLEHKHYGNMLEGLDADMLANLALGHW